MNLSSIPTGARGLIIRLQDRMKGISLFLAALGGLLTLATARAADKKPNILVIWGDDIGTWNVSHNNRGMMGYRTPNIDRLAREGLSFTDYYGQQSCTAGRAAFIGGNNPMRTGMPKVGISGAIEDGTNCRRTRQNHASSADAPFHPTGLLEEARPNLLLIGTTSPVRDVLGLSGLGTTSFRTPLSSDLDWTHDAEM